MKESVPQPAQEGRESHAMLPEIEELREPAKRLLEQLRPHLEKGEYQLIVGHDSSGRIPTLLLQRVIKEVYKKGGHKIPPIVFFAPRLPNMTKVEYEEYKEAESLKIDPWAKYVKKYILPSLPQEKPIKILIVTDTVTRGNSILNTEKVLKTLGREDISADVATIGLDGSARNENTRNWLGKKLGGQIFYGQGITPWIYQKEELSGVQQAYPKSQPFANVLREHPKMTQERNPQRAREDTELLAKELLEWYERKFKV